VATCQFLRDFLWYILAFLCYFAILGFVITYVVFTIGFGGAILTLLGTRPKEKAATTTPHPSLSPRRFRAIQIEFLLNFSCFDRLIYYNMF
jgi:hypothetical protein